MEGDWELSKENIQPRKEGRDINSLMAGLTPRKDGMTKMQDQMRYVSSTCVGLNFTGKQVKL